ncbi:MAG: glycosyltransferase [Fibrobacter sp.]|nr:glycosyltransferase [Fibrobacter sp.]
MDISIVIPTFKRQSSLERLLTSINLQDYPKDKFEVIVVDDHSGENLDPIIRNYQKNLNVRWVISKVKGRPGARNTGVAEAIGRIIIFLDDDMEVEPSFFEAHEKSHNQGLCVVSGCIKAAAKYTGLWNTVIDSRFDLRDDKLNINRPQSFTSVFTGNMSVLKKTFNRMNGFDEVTFSYYGGEDFDFGIRCIQEGIPISYCADAVALHHEKKWTKKTFCDYTRWAAYSMAILVNKHRALLLHDPAMKGFPCRIPGIYEPKQNSIKLAVKRILQTGICYNALFYSATLLWLVGNKKKAIDLVLLSRRMLYERVLQRAIEEKIA